MNQKTIPQKFILSAVFALALFGGFGFFGTNDAKAGYCVYEEREEGAPGATAFNYYPRMDSSCQADKCENGIYNNLTSTSSCSYTNDKTEADKLLAALTKKTTQKTDQEIKNALGEPTDGLITTAIKWLLQGILTVIGWLIAIAATLFEWIIQPDSLNAVISNPAIYSAWEKVRDTLNVAFILVLLFSAFATVFQVDKFSYKRILLTVVIMALLVNFSFPIARVIIDFSNVIMYYFLNSLDVTGSFAEIANKGNLAKILKPGPSADITFLISAIIFSFIFAITILTIAVLLVIRTIALGILIIFSSLAFVGTIVPFLSSKASSWWDNLFRYSFFGPIMIFMLYIAKELMGEIAFRSPSFVEIAGVQASSGLEGFIAAASFFAIPIVILWIGIGTAQSMSIAGAGAVVGKAQKWGKWLATRPQKAVWWGAKQTGIPGGVQQKYAHWKKGGLFGSEAREEREARMAGRLGVPKVVEQLDAKKVKDAKEKHDTENMTTGDLQNLSLAGNRFEKAAAIQELANRSQATQTQLDSVRETFGETSQVFRQLANKVKTYDPVAAFSHIADNRTREDRLREFMESNQFDVKKVGANSLGNDEFIQMLFDTNNISVKDVLDISKTSPGKKNAINTSLGNIIGANTISTDPSAQNIHMAYFAQTGNIGDPAFANHIFSNMNQDTASKLSAATVANPAYTNMIADNINSGQMKTIIQNMKDNTARVNLVRHIRSAAYTPAAGTNGQAVKNTASTDPYLSNL